MPFDPKITRGPTKTKEIRGTQDMEAALRMSLNALEPMLTSDEKEKIVSYYRDKPEVFYFNSYAKFAWKRDDENKAIGRILRINCAIERNGKLDEHYEELNMEAL
jgi:hypothetical protein